MSDNTKHHYGRLTSLEIETPSGKIELAKENSANSGDGALAQTHQTDRKTIIVPVGNIDPAKPGEGYTAEATYTISQLKPVNCKDGKCNLVAEIELENIKTYPDSDPEGVIPIIHQTDRKCPICHCLLMADIVEGLLFCRQYDCSYTAELGGEL